MKGHRFSAMTLAILILMIFGAEPVRPQNVGITDYKTPISRAQSFFIDFNSSYSMKGERINSRRGNLELTYRRFYDSIPFGYSIDAIGSLSLEGEEKEGTKVDYLSDAGFRIKKYIEGDAFSSLNLHQSYLKSYDRPAVDLTASLGYGRFMNATALAKAVRIEDLLMEEGVISGRMPRENILDLAKVIDREREYREKFGPIYRERWYEDMEGIIRDSGKLTQEHISAIGVLRMQEVLTRERITDRLYGWDLSVGVKQELMMPRKETKRPAPALDLTVRYARPLGWRIMWSEEMVVNSPFGPHFLDEYKVALTSLFAYEIANRISLNINHLLNLNRFYPEGKLALNNLLNVIFIFYIENKLNLVLSEKISKPENEKIKTAFAMTLNYRIF
ncbi:hypothetical protein J7M22_03815 [Candidatus Poribacteria bacterium]|nr:hypothetical protein [Candidatus Poribacteria bacterium]